MEGGQEKTSGEGGRSIAFSLGCFIRGRCARGDGVPVFRWQLLTYEGGIKGGVKAPRRDRLFSQKRA